MLVTPEGLNHCAPHEIPRQQRFLVVLEAGAFRKLMVDPSNAAPERQARSIRRLCSEFLVACPLEGPVRHHQSPQLFISDLHEVSESSSHDAKD